MRDPGLQDNDGRERQPRAMGYMEKTGEQDAGSADHGAAECVAKGRGLIGPVLLQEFDFGIETGVKIGFGFGEIVCAGEYVGIDTTAGRCSCVKCAAEDFSPFLERRVWLLQETG